MMSLAAAFKKRWDRFDLDIAFQIDEGLTVLFGPSGAGKTTTLRCSPMTGVWRSTERFFTTRPTAYR
jgi:ABC-type molybdate transport system ATPase subunit